MYTSHLAALLPHVSPQPRLALEKVNHIDNPQDLLSVLSQFCQHREGAQFRQWQTASGNIVVLLQDKQAAELTLVHPLRQSPRLAYSQLILSLAYWLKATTPCQVLVYLPITVADEVVYSHDLALLADDLAAHLGQTTMFFPLDLPSEPLLQPTLATAQPFLHQIEQHGLCPVEVATHGYCRFSITLAKTAAAPPNYFFPLQQRSLAALWLKLSNMPFALQRDGAGDFFRAQLCQALGKSRLLVWALQQASLQHWAMSQVRADLRFYLEASLRNIVVPLVQPDKSGRTLLFEGFYLPDDNYEKLLWQVQQYIGPEHELELVQHIPSRHSETGGPVFNKIKQVFDLYGPVVPWLTPVAEPLNYLSQERPMLGIVHWQGIQELLLDKGFV